MKKLTAGDLSWFDAAHYDPVLSWRLGDWVAPLMLRSSLRSSLGQIDEAFLVALLEKPAAQSNGKPFVFSTGFKRVRELQVMDFFYPLHSEYQDCFEDCRDAVQAWLQEIANNDDYQPPELLDKPYIGLIKERTPLYVPEDLIAVDLSATDSQIMNDFRVWLSDKRRANRKTERVKDVSESERSNWHKYMALAYIDIQLFCDYTKTDLTNAHIGRLLFPEEYDVDLTERVRKVVQPMAERLLNPEFLSGLMEQAARTEQESRDSVPE